ncbi:MAG: hypothetical protein KKC75_07870 [Nanoarchaeota archaeon]|nr:hypothetical protein [Nanoarchaeota archaeon]MBU1945684.1 hypothetical protein [Nanoarchaeota archaeon]
MLNPKSIIYIILAILLFNNNVYPLIPLPGILSLLIMATAAIALIIAGVKGSFIGKVSLVIGVIILLDLLPSLLSYIGISLPIPMILYAIGTLLLLISPFMGA